jgi:hypothetical protein
MKKFLMVRPSPAMVVALIALLVALAGTAYAAKKIDGTLIKKGSEPGNRIEDFSISAKQIYQGSLLQVHAANVMAAEVPNDCHAVIDNLAGSPTGKIKIEKITASPAGNECNVTFPHPIGPCPIVLGTLESSPFGSPGAGETTYRKLSSTVVQVSRRDSGGGTPTAGFFSIAAICPHP